MTIAQKEGRERGGERGFERKRFERGLRKFCSLNALKGKGEQRARSGMML